MVLYFLFFITKNEDQTQTRLANYIREIDRDIGEEGNIYPNLGVSGSYEVVRKYNGKYFFDNDFENYPVSEGDFINIRTEKYYSRKVIVNPVDPSRGNEADVGVSAFFTFLIELDPL